MGSSVESLWHVLGHLVKGERILRETMDKRARAMKEPDWVDSDAEFETPYLAGFEHLAHRASQFKKREALQLSGYDGPLIPLITESRDDAVTMPQMGE